MKCVMLYMYIFFFNKIYINVSEKVRCVLVKPNKNKFAHLKRTKTNDYLCKNNNIVVKYLI